MANFLSFQIISKVIFIASCLALVECKASNGLFLGNFIGCNSFGCRIQALEADVAQLKQQVTRLMDPSGMNNFRPNGMNQLPYNQNMNQGMQGNQQQATNQQQQQQQLNQQQQGTNTNGNTNRVAYGLDYPINQGSLQRVSNYPNAMNNQQFLL